MTDPTTILIDVNTDANLNEVTKQALKAIRATSKESSSTINRTGLKKGEGKVIRLWESEGTEPLTDELHFSIER